MSQAKTIKSIIFLAIFIGGLFCFANSANAIWYDSNWQYKKLITIDEAKIDENLTNFPVLVALASSTNFDFAKARDDGYDVIFTKDDEATLLDFERERYSTTTGNAEFWVEIPSVASSTASTTFYMYYGNSGASDIASSTAPWDANYVMVHHLIGAAYTNLDDSTVNDNDISAESGTPSYNVDAKIGKGVDTDDPEYLTATNNASLQLTTGITLETWVDIDDLSKERPIIGKYYGGDSNRGYGNSIKTSGEVWFILGTVNANYVTLTTNDFSLTTGTWYYLVCTWSLTDGNTMRLYKNGVASGVTASKSTNIGNPPRALDIGYGYGFLGDSFDGTLDEVRISNIARSAAWIKASYNSGNDSLLAYGAEEGGAAAEAPQIQIIIIE